MDTFLIQTVNNRPAFDFQITLLDAIAHQRLMEIRPWAERFDYAYFNCAEDETDMSLTQAGCIPIGGVGYCIDYMKYHYDIDYKPIGLPPDLMVRQQEFYGREICVMTDDDVYDLKEPFFLKYIEKPKVLSMVFENSNAIFGELPKGKYIVSEVVKIDAEWRAFVYKHKLVGLHPYGGDFTLFPDVGIIRDIIAAYESAPVAYTLDVGVSHDWRDTFIIEVDDFMSCGLAGFCDRKILPQMYRDWWKYIIKNQDTVDELA